MSERVHILLVEDEPSIAKVVAESLEQKGYIVTHCADGKKALNVFRNGAIDLCIADVMLPSMDGFEMVREIRKAKPDVPVLFLTAKTATADLMEGYQSGGNDYLKKPFSLEELFLRVAELLRRSRGIVADAAQPATIGKFIFRPDHQTLQFENEPAVRLSNKETLLLGLLVASRNELIERSTALLRVWGEDTFFNGRTMDVFITKLCKHLRKDPSLEIINVRGLGYKLIC